MEELYPEDIEQLLQELKEDETEAERMTDEASPPPSDKAAQHLEQAFALENEDEYERALDECDTALRLDPSFADAHNLRGVILEELGREREAVLAYREALRLDPSFDAARESLQAIDTKLTAHGHSPLPPTLLCTGRTPDLRQCPHEPAFTCLTCGDPLCHEHARFFQTSRDDPSGYEYVGTYCDRHHRKLTAAPAGEERATGLLSRLRTSNHRPWGVAYLPILIGATCLVFVVEGEWAFWAAGVVWIVGGFLGLTILREQGSTIPDELDSALEELRGCQEPVALAFTLGGPFILLAALLAESRSSAIAGHDASAEGGEQIPATTTRAQPTPFSPPTAENGRVVNRER